MRRRILIRVILLFSLLLLARVETAWSAPPANLVAPLPAVMSIPRAGHSATLLAGGSVLICGGMGDRGESAELYDPVRRQFVPTGSLAADRTGHAAVRLDDGRVLVLGGWRGRQILASTEIYDPASGSWSLGPEMTAPRAACAATRLADGRVLVTGGVSAADTTLPSAEIFDPSQNLFLVASDMASARAWHTATALSDGGVLVVGGSPARGQVLASSERFDPKTGAFAPAGEMSRPRQKHAAVALADGRLLVAGGCEALDGLARLDSLEVFDPAAAAFSPVGGMIAPRYRFDQAVVPLPDGRVLLAGGAAFAEVLDVTRRRCEPLETGFGSPRLAATATLLRDGSVLIAGGYDPQLRITDAAWIYRP